LITRPEADRLRKRLLDVLQEDAHNAERLFRRLETITEETGIGAHAALLLILTHLPFEEEEARRHWESILARREEMSRALGRDAGVRVALLDYFVNVNRRLVEPTLIDLEMYEAVLHESGADPLTGLASDRRFRNALQQELRRARRYAQPTAVVLADVDDFGEINARFGRLIGDRLLRELAIVIKNNVRDIDLAARPGEDEVALLLPETDRNGALLVAERFRWEVETFFGARQRGGRPVALTVSAGVACYPADATTPDGLLQSAAQALYQAKAAGRTGVQLFRPERRRWLRFDLEPGRFEIEVVAPADRASLRPRDVSRGGILFGSPEALEVGERVEIRISESAGGPAGGTRLRGRVVRLEELPEPPGADPRADEDRYEIGVALDADADATGLVAFLEEARAQGSGNPT
jgi:diguanylate cyclase (GGDEF)-like protein